MKIKRKVQKILDVFQEISAIPRCSKNEEKICRWLLDWSDRHGFASSQDAAGNILIRVPASSGYEHCSPVILQGHVDMVCEKTPESTHDFSCDPIRLVYDEEWVRADGTSLGADNGLAIAMAMVVAEDKKVRHPPLELLFTVDEETGLTGANNLEPGVLKGRRLLNLDSEDEGVFTIGCAGGRDSHVSLPLYYEEVPCNFRSFKINADGMIGGHSGVNIHEGRASAIKVVGRALNLLRSQMPVRLTFIGGGTAHNAIPRFCHAVLFLPEDMIPRACELMKNFAENVRSEYRSTDPDLRLTFTDINDLPDRRAVNEEMTSRAISLVMAFPHGVAAMSREMPGLVETSSNLANIKVENGELKLIASQRSSVMSRLDAVTEKIAAVAYLAGATFQSHGGYPAWQPNLSSPLLALFRETYKKMFRKEARIEAIHAGLECGIIGSAYPDMDMISLGATIKDPHCTQERMHIDSIGKVWDLLVKVLEAMDD